MEKHEQLWARSKHVTPGGVHSNTRHIRSDWMPARAKGARIVMQDGKQYLDYHAAFGPIVLGHAHDKVNDAVIRSLADADLFGIGVTELEVLACEKIVQHVPSAEKVLLTNSGTEATFHAIRLSRAATGRKKIIKFQGCYHGWHDYVARNMLSAANMIGKRDAGSAGMLDEAIDSTLVCRFNDLAHVEATIRQHRGDVAALIVEPIPHNIGCVLPEPGFMQGLRELTRSHGIVLIFDEVITGFRHDLGGFQKVLGVTPDLTTLGKAMANGYPVAAICGKSAYMDLFTTQPSGNVLFAGTYNGHTVGTAAIVATIHVMETEPVHTHTFALGAKLRRGLQAIADRLALPMSVQGYGSVVVPYFTREAIRNYEDVVRTDTGMDVAFRHAMIEQGFFMTPLAMKRNHIMFDMTEADIDATLEAAEHVLKHVKPGGPI